MQEDVKGGGARRRYVSPLRAGQAAATRDAVLGAALELFGEQGYVRTPVSAVAARAGVAVDTVYASAGRKPDLLRALLEQALSGTAETVPGPEREYARRIRATPAARDKLAVYADALVGIGERMAPVHRALREAALVDDECAALRAEVSARRAENMLLLAADLRATGELRPDLTDRQVADVLWLGGSAEQRALLVHERGWSAAALRDWLTDTWVRTLLQEPPPGPSAPDGTG